MHPGCVDSSCIDCHLDAAKCRICAEPLVSFEGDCVKQCPSGYVDYGGVCNKTSASPSSSSGYSEAGLITGVTIGVSGVIALVVYFRVRVLRRQVALEDGLREALLSSQKEGVG